MAFGSTHRTRYIATRRSGRSLENIAILDTKPQRKQTGPRACSAEPLRSLAHIPRIQGAFPGDTNGRRTRAHTFTTGTHPEATRQSRKANRFYATIRSSVSV